MSILEKSVFFGGGAGIGDNDLGKMEVANFSSDVDEVLATNFQWRGKALAAVGLTLSPDKLRITNGTFLTRGDLELKDKKMAANSIWGTAKPNINISIVFPSANVFQFDSGGLWSNFVPSSLVPHSFFDSTEGRGGRPLLPTDERLEGTEPGFCIRMVAQISSQSSSVKGVVIKAVILLFPASADDMTGAVESAFAGWPGLKIGEVFIPLGPRPTEMWRCPVLPFIKPPTPFEVDDLVPECGKLRNAIAAIMRKARLHEGLKSGPDVVAKWAKIRSSPRDLADKLPSIMWPDLVDSDAEDRDDQSGEYSPYLNTLD